MPAGNLRQSRGLPVEGVNVVQQIDVADEGKKPAGYRRQCAERNTIVPR